MKKSAILSVFALLFCGILTAQDIRQTDAPKPSSQLLGSQLIVWSEVQRPKPIPETATFQQPANSDALVNQDGTPHAELRTGSFAGVIERSEGGLALRTPESVCYRLGSEVDLQAFEGKTVRISGAVEPGSNVLHVAAIRLGF